MSRYDPEKNFEHEFKGVRVIATSDKALLLALSGESPEDAQWFPKSQIDWTLPAEKGDVVDVYVPEWLAENHGWI